DGDVVEGRGAAEVLERERLEPVEMDRRRDLVVGEPKLLGGHRQAVLQAREDEDRLRPVLADEGPRAPELSEVVLGAREELAAGVRERRCEGVAEPVATHDRLLLLSSVLVPEITTRGVGRDVAVLEIGVDQPAIPPARIAVTATARKLETDDVAHAEGHLGRARRRDRHVVHEDPAERARTGAEEALGREAQPARGSRKHEGRSGIERAVIEGAQRQLLAEAPAPLAGAARDRDQLSPLADERWL